MTQTDPISAAPVSARGSTPNVPGDAPLQLARQTLEFATSRLAELARRSTSLTADAQANTAALVARLASAEQAASAETELITAAIERDHKQRLDEIEAKFRGLTVDADRKLTVSKGMSQEEAGSLIGRLRREKTERVWMAETMFDSAKDRPRQEQELVRRELEPRQPQLARLRTIATESLQALGITQLPAPMLQPDEVDQSALENADPEMLDTAGLDAAAGPKAKPTLPPGVMVAVDKFTSANAAVQKLVNLKTPRLYAMPWPILIAIGAGLALASAGLWLDAWQARIKLPILFVIGAIVAVVLLYMLRPVLRARALRRAQIASSILSDAENTVLATLEQAASRRSIREKAIAHRRDREIRQATTLADTAESGALLRLKNDLAALVKEHAAATSGARGTRDAELAAHTDAIASRRGAEAARSEAQQAALEQERVTGKNDLAAANTALLGNLRRDYTAFSAGLAQQRAVLTELAFSGSPPWHQAELSPHPPGSRPWIVIGHVRQELAIDQLDALESVLGDGATALERAAFDCPVALQPPQAASLLIESSADRRREAVNLLKVACLRALLALPAGKVRFTLIDPVGLGESFAGLMHLADSNPIFVHDRIWTETKHIEARLTDLTEHMETVIQKYLRSDFATIDDYNRQAGEVAEPYRFLVIADLPSGFSEQAASRLASIVQSGVRCGIYTFIAADAKSRLPAPTGGGQKGGAGFGMADIARASLTLQHRSGKLTVNDDLLSKLPFTAATPPADAELTPIVKAAGELARTAASVRVGFDLVLPSAQARWTADNTHSLRVPLGRLGANKLQYLTLGVGTAQHALVAGRTGSGKSTLLNVIITAAAAWYSPDQLEMYLVDFKKGVEFRAYAAAKLPHARVVAIESEREFGLSVLRRLDDELRQRGQAFRDVGAQDLAAFRAAKPGAHMPRSLLLIDEFQEFFSEDDRIASEAGLLLDRLVRQGRAFGMHVVLGSQTLAGAYSLARATIGQMAVRVALQCSEADSYLILSEDNAAARLLSRPGEAIYNDASGMLEGNSLFQVAWLSDEQRTNTLAEVSKLDAQRAPGAPQHGPIVFEGTRPAQLHNNAQLASELASRISSPGMPERRPLTLALGEPLAIKGATAAIFTRASGGNALLVSQREDAATGMLLAAVSAAAAGLSAARPAAYGGLRPAASGLIVLDGTPADSSFYQALAKQWPAGLPGLSAPSYQATAETIAGLHAELIARREGDLTDEPSVLLMISQLHRFRILRKAEDEYATAFGAEAVAPTPAGQLAEILRDGPQLGIHALIWCDTAANVERTFPRGTLKEFDQRVLTQMSAGDSNTMMDSPLASNLGQDRAVLFTESLGTAERFRPYAPSDERFAVPPSRTG